MANVHAPLDVMLRNKRTYDSPEPADGQRILVERLWPRGLKKEALAASWMKDVAPSTELRRWFGHEIDRWDEFQRRYRAELDAHPDAWRPIAEASRRGTVTLLYSAHDVDHNSAVVLRAYLAGTAKRSSARRPALRRRPVGRAAKRS